MTGLRRFCLLSGLVGLAVIACAAAPPEEAQPAQQSPTAWAIEVKTSGGFVGIGRGGVRLTSAGEVTAWRPRTPGESVVECRGLLSSEEHQSLERAIRELEPDGWRHAGLEVAAPDAFGYRLTVELGEVGQEARAPVESDDSQPRAHTAVWHDNTADRLPRDLAALHLAASAPWSRVAESCAR